MRIVPNDVRFHAFELIADTNPFRQFFLTRRVND